MTWKQKLTAENAEKTQGTQKVELLFCDLSFFSAPAAAKL
jgi:hypothetical protein